MLRASRLRSPNRRPAMTIRPASPPAEPAVRGSLSALSPNRAASPSPSRGDDLYMSGVSMQYVAMKLKEAGASRVLGLSIVKSRSNTAR